MPPVIPLYRRGDAIVLDGGLIDNAPADIVGPARSALVLLSRERCPVASDSDVCSMREQIECGRFDRPWDSDSGVGY